MHKRINITLPESTIRMIDRVVKKGGRSAIIDAAIKNYILETGKNNLRKMLKEGAIDRAERDLKLSEEWASLQDEL